MSGKRNHPASDTAFFLGLETQVWQALEDGDATADFTLLTPDFLGVYPSGISDRAGHASQLEEGPSIQQFALFDARSFWVGDDAVMLSYLAQFTRAGGSDTETMYVSSLWVQRDGAWRNLFSQDTPKAG